MKLALDSWHRKLYNMTYDIRVPRSLCGYFWVIVLAVVLFIPLTVLSIPNRLLGFFREKDEDNDVQGDEVLLASSTAIFGLIVYAGLAEIVCMIWLLFDASLPPIIVFGGFGWLIVLSIIIIWLKTKWANRYRKPRPMKEKKPSLIGSYLKAKKEKICPIIEWE